MAALPAPAFENDFSANKIRCNGSDPIEKLFLVMLFDVIEGQPLRPEIRRGIALDQIATGICEPGDAATNQKALATTRTVQFSVNNLSTLTPIIALHSEIAFTIRAGKVLKQIIFHAEIPLELI